MSREALRILHVNGPFERKEAEDSSANGRFEQKRVGKPFSVKMIDDEGTIEGHGAVFNVVHPTSSWMLGPEWKDVIRPGAFTKSLAEHKKLGTTPIMLWMHDRGNIPGAWRTVEEDKDGLFVAGPVSKRAISPSGVPTHELLKLGAVTGLSIGFSARKVALDQEKKLRELLEVDLAEISIVDIPGGPSARITDVKSDPLSINFLESVLRDAGLSRKQAKALLAEGFPALRDAAANVDDDGNTGSESLVSVFRELAQTISPKPEFKK